MMIIIFIIIIIIIIIIIMICICISLRHGPSAVTRVRQEDLHQYGAHQEGNNPAIACLSDGQFLITWINKGDYRFCACPKHSRNALQCLRRASVLFARREPDSGTQHC